MNFVWVALISLLVGLKYPDPRVMAVGVIITAMVITMHKKESMDVSALQKSLDAVTMELENIRQATNKERALLAVGDGKRIMAMEMSEEESGAPIKMGKDVKRSFEEPAKIRPVMPKIKNQTVEIKEVMERQ